MRLVRSLAGLACGVAGLAGFGSLPANAEDSGPTRQTIAVLTDHAMVVRLPLRTSTVIVGNPMIADVTIQRNGTAVVTGKSYGSTNMIVQDAAGITLDESTIRVASSREAVVTLHRGMERESYICAERCEVSPLLGDTSGYFSAMTGQSSSRAAQAK